MNKDFLKEFATAFFYKWYNSPGTNTEEGFERWYDTEEAQSILSKHGINTDVSGSLPPDYDLDRLYEWIMDENRQPAKTAFTSGSLRKVADEIEFRLWRQ